MLPFIMLPCSDTVLLLGCIQMKILTPLLLLILITLIKSKFLGFSFTKSPPTPKKKNLTKFPFTKPLNFRKEQQIVGHENQDRSICFMLQVGDKSQPQKVKETALVVQWIEGCGRQDFHFLFAYFDFLNIFISSQLFCKDTLLCTDGAQNWHL